MSGKRKYKLRIHHRFSEQVAEILEYIARKLNNPIAAEAFEKKIEEAVLDRLPFAESFQIYQFDEQTSTPYYTIPVKNYTILYVVIDDVMEVRQIVYSRRNWRNLT
ncbi:MAG: type II toxin-antitoxin system RelE/ParE family toxin [Oscillibacter sp.]|nr:type II toxin-antitoxin system RelE/ParE family toxin [Oscillibacter sp.]